MKGVLLTCGHLVVDEENNDKKLGDLATCVIHIGKYEIVGISGEVETKVREHVKMEEK